MTVQFMKRSGRPVNVAVHIQPQVLLQLLSRTVTSEGVLFSVERRDLQYRASTA